MGDVLQSLQLEPQVVSLLALAAVALAVVLLLVVVIQGMRLRRLRRTYRRALPEGRDVFEELLEQQQRQQAMHEEMRTRLAAMEQLAARAVTGMGMVRYDAFEDMGGALSFSAALMDEQRDGLVISAINGRSETRIYAKPVEGAASEHHLSTEEQAAIDRALAGGRQPVDGRRRQRRGA